MGFEIYDNNSTGTNNKAKYNEVPEGKNKVKNFIPWILTHMIFIPKNIVKLKASVVIIWLVTVKVYGTKPIIFKPPINKNITKIKGKK